MEIEQIERPAHRAEQGLRRQGRAEMAGASIPRVSAVAGNKAV